MITAPASVVQPKPLAPPRGGAHVHVRVGNCDIAIPVEQVQEALPMPPGGLTRLPRRTGALLGLADTAGGPVPVVALERWLPMEDGGGAPSQRLLILQHAGSRVGLRVDAALGVKPLPACAVRRVHHGGDDSELFESVVPASDEAPTLCVLEVARLMQLSQAWSAAAGGEDVPTAPASAGRAATALRAAKRYAVFLIGDELWAVPIGVVQRVTPVPAVELAFGAGQRSWAISEWQGRKLPLVDLSAARQASSRESAPWMVQLNQGPFSLGLTVAVCRQIVDLPDDLLVATPDDEVLGAIAVCPELGKLRVLDPAKLFRVTPETSISRNAEVPSRRSGVAQANATEASPYLVFEADQRYASPVGGIVGVVELPEGARDDLRNGQRAALAWRGRAVRVVNLPTLTGGAACGADARLAVLVQPPDADAPPLAIAIQRLSDWLPAHSARRSGMRMGDLGAFSLVDAPGSPDNASLVVVDLAQIAYLLA